MFRNLDKSQSFPEMEERLQKLWEADDSFKKSVQARPAEKTFTFNDGPPFATGLPHYGHLLAGTIKDIVPRYWTMKGYRVERRFGWDCHGLPIENIIQDKLALHTVRDINEYGVDRFNEACRAGVLTYTREWRKTVSRMGRWVDFDNEYKTMDMTFMESVWWVFKQCFDKGLIYQGYRIQPYSPALATSLSNFEVNQGYKDRQDPSVTLSFPLERLHGEMEDESILVWTTTPWTLPSNMAIAMNPEMMYSLVRHEGKLYWIAEARRAAYFQEGKHEVVGSRKGIAFTDRRYKPLFQYMPYMTEKQYTILMADFVTAEDGAGSVHIAPSFGEEDFQLGKKEGLGLFDPLDAEGKFTKLVPDWEGIGAKDADKSILQKLKADGRVFKHETFVHSYPHCWRTDVPLLYRAQKNWFLSLDKEITSAEGETKTLKEWMIHCNKQINWVPDHIKGGRFGKWLDGARDWNLSRNRFWGTCIPVWLAEDGDMLCVGSAAELEAADGRQGGRSAQAHRGSAGHPHQGQEDLRRGRQGIPPHAGGARLLVRIRLHALCAAPLSFREQGMVQGQLPRGLHRRRPGSDARLVLYPHRAGRRPVPEAGVQERDRQRHHPGRGRPEDVQAPQELSRSQRADRPHLRRRHPPVHVRLRRRKGRRAQVQRNGREEHRAGRAAAPVELAVALHHLRQRRRRQGPALLAPGLRSRRR